eukprot:scaffold2429_cov263-Pinguiococcus_pyrenoidosus.AAC.7
MCGPPYNNAARFLPNAPNFTGDGNCGESNGKTHAEGVTIAGSLPFNPPGQRLMHLPAKAAAKSVQSSAQWLALPAKDACSKGRDGEGLGRGNCPLSWKD